MKKLVSILMILAMIVPLAAHKAEKAKDFNEILMKQHEQKKSIKL